MPRLLLVLTLTAGAASAQTTTTPPVPSAGRRVDIGGGQHLYLNCTGKGSPTVILEAGAGDFAEVWSLVQPRVAEFTRVCSYDRGGYMWSDPGARPRTYAQLALELRTTLDRAGETPPFILVGQSYGGLVVRGFAKRYARDVKGMVLVDAVHEDQQIVWGGEAHRLRDAARGRPSPAPRIALDTQWVRLARDSSLMSLGDTLPAPLDRLSADAQRLWLWGASQPIYRMAWAAEMDWSPEELARMYTERKAHRASLGDMPLVVLPRTVSVPADSLERERQALMADLAALSTRGRLEYARASGHNIHIEEPELVVRAIKAVVSSAQGRTAPSRRYSFFFNSLSCSAMKARIWSAMSSSLVHCS
jgi:pimeloyl-ACP methyl ester carboxylesterase